MMAATVISIMTALAAPTAISFRVKVIWYMKVAGSAVAEPGPAPVTLTLLAPVLLG